VCRAGGRPDHLWPKEEMNSVRNPWVGLDLTADPMAWARLLRRAYDQAQGGGEPAPILRDVITRSWARSRHAGAAPDRTAPSVLDEREARERWAAHPLARFSDLVAQMLGSYTHAARQIVVIADADGTLLWSDGHREVLTASDRIAFVPGRLWTEAAAGTNGIGTALELGHPVQIFSAEHLNPNVHGWTCSGAPVRDPESGETLGVLDLSSGIRVAHPNSLALVTAVADVVMAQLRVQLAERDARIKGRYLERLGGGGRQASALVSPSGRTIAAVPAGWLGPRIDVTSETLVLPSGVAAELEPLPRGEGFLVTQVAAGRSRTAPGLRLRVLGRERAVASINGSVVELSRRHSEIVTLLLLRPDGLSCEQLATELYGDSAKRVTMRAEISRLRRALGPRVTPDPYRLTGDVQSDLADVERLLAGGRASSARALARSGLLPGAQAPAIVAARAALQARLDHSASSGDASAARSAE
jgi:GAF domain-containing protein